MACHRLKKHKVSHYYVIKSVVVIYIYLYKREVIIIKEQIIKQSGLILIRKNCLIILVYYNILYHNYEILSYI